VNVARAKFATVREELARLSQVVEDLQERLRQAPEAERIIQRAGYPETMLYGADRRQAPPCARRGHLHAVGKSQPAD
jgi:hypothetical protein